MKHYFVVAAAIAICSACQQTPAETVVEKEETQTAPSFVLEAENLANSSFNGTASESDLSIPSDEWASYEIDVPETGRYRVEVKAKSDKPSSIWIEDYINNTDERTYNITGKMMIEEGGKWNISSKDGSPLKKGKHPIKIHVENDTVDIDHVSFSLIQGQKETPKSFTQNMIGSEWKLVWSDEFDGDGLVDSTKWSYNIGNWGWGNNEPQYYTGNRTKNARQEDGNLIIEAHKNDMGNPWTSTRLTTQGKQSFLYGKIEFRAKVPAGRGTWAAGWLLGDSYEDELSWPYCGEIDVLECVGFEINDTTGNGLNHATCHTPKYYFKKGNQIGSDIEIENMNNEFHTYAIEWYPDVIYGFLDGEKYYTYDKSADEMEWPFHQPQNIILNLAVGGGWGGAKGIDENWGSHQYIIDYVRVFELTEN